MKNNLKKRLTLALAAIMASSSICVTSFGATYADIDDVPWSGASAIIESVSSLGLISGYEDNTFRAHNDVTYLETMQMIYNVLVKTGSNKYMDILDQASYTYVLNAYSVPSWAQTAVAYFLYTGTISTADLGIYMSGGTGNAATRGDVAEILGNALVSNYSFDRNASAANSYADYWKISSDQLEQIDLVTRLGIFSGNTSNYFAPDNNINRAEMAVVLNKTYSVLADNTANTGEIIDITMDGAWYDITVQFDYGDKTLISALSGGVGVYADAAGTVTMSLSRLSEGDRVSVYYSSSGAVSEIRVVDGDVSSLSSSSSGLFDVTGNLTEIDDYIAYYENTNTGDEEELEFKSSCVYYLDGDAVSYSELVEAVEDMDDSYAYAGMNLTYIWDKDDEDTEVDVYINEIYVTLTDEYHRDGKITKMTDTYIQILSTDGVETFNIYFASGCDFFFEGSSIDDDDAQDYIDNGTFYAEFICNSAGKALEVNLTEDPTPGFSSDYEVYQMSKFSSENDRGGSDIIVVYEGDDKVGYPYTDDTNFFVYDYDDKDWSLSSRTEAKGIFEDEDDFDGDAYARMVYNVYGELVTVYIAPTSTMFKYTLSSMLQRYGEVMDYDKTDGFTLSTSKYTYTMMSQYNVTVKDTSSTTAYTGSNPNGSGDVKYPLSIPGTTVSSLSVFQNIMANLDDLKVEFDLVAAEDGVVQGLEMLLVEAEGTFISYDEDEEIMTIELSDGYEMKLDVSSNPDVEAEDDEDFELEDLTAYKYKGTEVTLEFDDGILETIYIGDTSTVSTIKGVAVSADGGLKLEGSSTVYTWSTASNTTTTNKSMTSTTLSTIQTAIDDPDIEVYVEIKLNINSGKVTTITAYVLEAEGELQEYNEDKGTARITTDAGNTYTFEFAAGYDIYIDDEEVEDERTINNKLVGETVTFDFNDNGKADAMYGDD